MGESSWSFSKSISSDCPLWGRDSSETWRRRTNTSQPLPPPPPSGLRLPLSLFPSGIKSAVHVLWLKRYLIFLQELGLFRDQSRKDCLLLAGYTLASVSSWSYDDPHKIPRFIDLALVVPFSSWTWASFVNTKGHASLFNHDTSFLLVFPQVATFNSHCPTTFSN